ncbi:MAG: ABC transporter permease [Erysipelotrichaceae bacterium]
MKTLMQFSLKRRFLNKATITLNVIILVVVGCIAFIDPILNAINPSILEPTIINVELDDNTFKFLSKLEQVYFKFDHNKDAEYTLGFKDSYTLTSDYPMKDEQFVLLTSMLDSYSKEQRLNEAGLGSILEEDIIITPIIKIETPKGSVSSSVVFMIITGIYFMMLSFATAIANEVVYEKSTKTLELILTSVSAKTHFLSKMIVGWLVIVVQCIISASIIGGWFLIRNIYDGGKGLLTSAFSFNLIPKHYASFSELLSSLDITSSLVTNFLLSLVFLCLGILFIQMLLVVISSFVSSIEEAGNIQAPFYLVLMGVYYLSISLNSPYQLSKGIAYILSYIPFFSMLFMPQRLLSSSVPLLEISLSLCFSLVSIYLVIHFGIKLYQKGVLNYSNVSLFKQISDRIHK